MLRVGLTGATGAIGQHFLEHLSKKGNLEIVALVRRRPSYESSNVRLILADILNIAALKTFVETSDVIVHLAARNPQTSAQDTEEMASFFAVNSLATAALAKLTQEYQKCLIHVSTVSVYELSRRKRGTFSEEEPLPGREKTGAWIDGIHRNFEGVVNAWVDGRLDNPLQDIEAILAATPPPIDESVYALSKYLGETWVSELRDSVILRLSNVYGSDDENSSRVIPTAMKAIREGNIFLLDFGLSEKFSFLYIGDVAKAFESCMEKATSTLPKIINVASPLSSDEIILVQHFRDISSEMGIPCTLKVQRTAKPQEFRIYSTELMEQCLGIKNPIPLLDGLKKMLSLPL